VTGLEEGTTPPAEIISVDLTCTNRRLPERLQLGEINVPTNTSPEFATFRNIRPISPSARPPLGEGLHWRLISHLALNHLSLDSVESFRGLLELYNFRALYDRQAARQGELLLRGIESVGWEPEEWFYRGALVRGRRTTIEMREENFACEGEMFLLASVLEVFLGLYATMNSFSRLRVKGMTHGEVYEWPPRAGHQILL
jgi:type VI secretion system protein ImpG